MNLRITRLDASVGTGLLRVEARNRKVKAQAIFFDDAGKRASADTMNIAVEHGATRVQQVAETLATLLDDQDPTLTASVRLVLEQALAEAATQTANAKEEEIAE